MVRECANLRLDSRGKREGQRGRTVHVPPGLVSLRRENLVKASSEWTGMFLEKASSKANYRSTELFLETVMRR